MKAILVGAISGSETHTRTILSDTTEPDRAHPSIFLKQTFTFGTSVKGTVCHVTASSETTKGEARGAAASWRANLLGPVNKLSELM